MLVKADGRAEGGRWRNTRMAATATRLGVRVPCRLHATRTPLPFLPFTATSFSLILGDLNGIPGIPCSCGISRAVLSHCDGARDLFRSGREWIRLAVRSITDWTAIR